MKCEIGHKILILVYNPSYLIVLANNIYHLYKVFIKLTKNIYYGGFDMFGFF